MARRHTQNSGGSLHDAFVMSALACLSLLCGSCSLSQWITRTETDMYTVTHRDTTVIENVRNLPGATEDTSRVAPRSRQIERYTGSFSFDSVPKRDYPNFLRIGLLEVAALYSPGRNNSASGLFGAYA